MAASVLLIEAGKPTQHAALVPEVLSLAEMFHHGGQHEFWTSGTTGPPKPISFSAEQIIWSAKLSIQAFSLSEGFSALLALPSIFVAGKMMVARALVGKADLWYVKPSLRPFNQDLPPLDFVALTPAQIQHTLAFPEDRERLQQVKNLLIGGGTISTFLEKELQLFPHRVFHSYGMTETLTHCALRNISPMRETYFRAHHSSISFKCQDGMLAVNYPKLTDGFLQTNDVVSMDKEGFIFLGRRDDLINLGGLKLFPATLEKKLPDAFFHGRAWFIAARSHETWGQVPWLWIEGEDDPELRLEELSYYLSGKEKLYGYSLVPRFARTESGKIRRKESIKRSSKSIVWND